MSVSKYKRKGSTEKELLILEATQETLWEVTSDSTSTNVCNISAYISGNTFVLYALKSCHSSLSNISSDTKVLFQALINDGVTYIADYYSNSADITPSGFKNPPHRIDY